MIHGVLLRWAVTGLFALGALECALPILTRRRPWTMVVSHGLHVLMAVAMAAMAWPWSMRSPTTALAVLFLLAAAWFATRIVAARTPAQRRVSGYHVLMMLATAWMYAAMDGYPPPFAASSRAAAAMPGMDMAATGSPPDAARLTWVTAMNWLGALIFGAATLFWIGRYLTDTGTARLRSLGNLAQAAMAAGMAILFLGALSRI